MTTKTAQEFWNEWLAAWRTANGRPYATTGMVTAQEHADTIWADARLAGHGDEMTAFHKAHFTKSA